MNQALALLSLVLAFVSFGCNEKRSTPSGPAPSAAADKPVVRVSAIPDENPTELMRKYEPLVAFLEKSLDAKVEYVPVTDYGAAVSGLAAGRVDFAWLGAFTHVQARRQAKVLPLCMRAVDREFKSVVVVGSGAGVEAMEQLKGKSFAFGSKSSTSGHLMPRHYLGKQFGLDPDADFDGRPVFSGSHDATVKLVESGRVTAGAVNMLVWRRMRDEKKVDAEKVKALWTTPSYVDYVWTARSALPQALRQKFLDAFLQLDAGNPADAKILALQDAQKFVAAAPADFDVVEKVALDTGLIEP